MSWHIRLLNFNHLTLQQIIALLYFIAAYITGFSVNQEFCIVIGVCKNVKENQHSKMNRKETNRNKKYQKQLQEPKKS